MSEQTHTAEETLPNEETQQEIDPNTNAEQTEPKENRSASGQEINGQVDNFSQMYDMLKERDETIKKLTSEVAGLKKENTNLVLKVNASASAGSTVKNPYENFIDSMVNR